MRVPGLLRDVRIAGVMLQASVVNVVGKSSDGAEDHCDTSTSDDVPHQHPILGTHAPAAAPTTSALPAATATSAAAISATTAASFATTAAAS